MFRALVVEATQGELPGDLNATVPITKNEICISGKNADYYAATGFCIT
jgi:hypothetical protein